MTPNYNASPEAIDVLNSIRRLVRALRLFSRESEKRSGLTAAQLFVLQQLADGEPIKLKELARRTMTDLSSVSVVADRLEAKGLLERRRSALDGRVREIWLSAKGKVLLRQAPDPLQRRLVTAVSKFKPEGRKALATSLKDLLREAGLDGERPSLMFDEELP
jgi:DNA-binding MarR family transcriptional regulator